MHNVLHVIATGETEGYYADFADDVWTKLGRALAEGFAYQGQPSAHSGKPRGNAFRASAAPTAFINFLQNHDQTGNRALGERLTKLADPRVLELMTAMLVLSPQIPMLFHGRGAWRPAALPVLHRFPRRSGPGGARRTAARIRRLCGLCRADG